MTIDVTHCYLIENVYHVWSSCFLAEMVYLSFIDVENGIIGKYETKQVILMLRFFIRTYHF